MPGNKNIYLVGSSNAIGIAKEAYVNGHVTDITRRGLSVIMNSSTCYVKTLPKSSKEIRIILVIGSNGHKDDEYSLFRENYVESLCELFKLGFRNHQIFAILPMTRGKDTSLYSDQLRKMQELKIGLKFLKVAAVCWDDLLPEGFNRQRRLFGKKDVKMKNFVHYSGEAKRALANYLEIIVENGFDRQRELVLAE